MTANDSAERTQQKMNHKILNRVIEKTKIPNLIELLADRISLGELHSLLLKIFELKIHKRKLSTILSEFQTSRFTKPSDINPITHRNLELKIFSLLPSHFEVIDLSPLTPLGTTSAMTTIHQNNVVSTIGNLEIASDTTNILALECAKRRRESLTTFSRDTDTIKLCSSQRVTRGQPFESQDFSAYFNVIALNSAGRDQGNETFEMQNLEEHIVFYLRLLEETVGKTEIQKVKVKFFNFAGFDNARIIEHLKTKISNRQNVSLIVENNSEFGKNYYKRLRFMISVINKNNQEFDYIDGGFTNWTQKLLNNDKERLLTSGIGTDFLLRTIKTQIFPFPKG